MYEWDLLPYLFILNASLSERYPLTYKTFIGHIGCLAQYSTLFEGGIHGSTFHFCVPFRWQRMLFKIDRSTEFYRLKIMFTFYRFNFESLDCSLFIVLLEPLKTYVFTRKLSYNSLAISLFPQFRLIIIYSCDCEIAFSYINQWKIV